MRQAAPVNVVGMTLSRSVRGASGVAVLDPDGNLVLLSATTSDEELVEAVSPHVQVACLLAIDAPVSTAGNADAATRSRPEEQDPRAAQRGSWVARRLGLDTNPRSGRARRAVQVSPRTAAAQLFGLPDDQQDAGERRPGRLRALIALVEGLAQADPSLRVDTVPAAEAWQALSRSVDAARADDDLQREDAQLGAVIGAYLGLRVVRSRDGNTRHDSSDAVRRYAELRPVLEDATTAYVRLVTSILDEAGINYLTVTGRTKSLASYATKASRTVDGEPVYPDPLRDITDQIGIRVITYVHSDVQAVVDLLADQVAVHEDRDLGEETASEGRFGYASRHLLIGVPQTTNGPDADPALSGHQAQVQIRTVLQHAWAEFEHDIRYKGSIPVEHAPDFDRRFTLAAGLLELADREFSAIRDRLPRDTPSQPPEPDDDDPRLSPRDLAAFLAGQFHDAGWSRTDHYAWIAVIVLELGITSLEDLGATLRPVDTQALTTRMGYRYPPGAVRRLDDALLWVHGEDYVRLSANRDRREALRARLARMRQTD